MLAAGLVTYLNRNAEARVAKSRLSLDGPWVLALRRLAAARGGQTTTEYMLAIFFLAVTMAYALPVLFQALADLFTQMGSEFAKPYP